MIIEILLLLFACSDKSPGSENHKELSGNYDETSPKIEIIDPNLEVLIKQSLQNTHGYDRLVALCDDIGHRISGSPQLDAAVIWAQEMMKEDGLIDVRTQNIKVNYWKRGREKLTLHKPTNVDLPILGLGMSISTPPTGIRSEVIVVRSFDELEEIDEALISGKIVAYNVPFTTYGETVQYRSKGPSKAAQKGAVAALVRSISPESYQSPHTGALSYDKGWEIPAAAITLEEAERFQRWQDRGKEIEVELFMDSIMEKNVPSANVIGEIRGSQRPDQIVVIGGHLDSWDVGQGAQDDGAGVIIAMEAARLIAQLKTSPKRTLRVVLFTNEENGLKGGRGYADDFGSKESHFAAIEADIGAGKPLYFSYKLPSERPDLESKIQKISFDMKPVLKRIGMKELEAGYPGADIGPLVGKGSMGFGLRMDTTGYWPIHHTHADTIDKIEIDNLQKNIAAMATLTWYLLNMPNE